MQEKGVWFKIFFPSISSLIGSIFFLVSLTPIQDYDIFWHLQTGKYIFENRAVPRVDPFSFTCAGKRWIAHEWLSDLIFYAICLWVGYKGLILLKSLIISFTYFLLFRSALKLFSSPLIIFVLIWFSGLAGFSCWSERPQIFSFLLFVIFIDILYLRKPIYRFLLPLLFIVWVNLHGVYILGLTLFLTVIIGEILDKWKQKSLIQYKLKSDIFIFFLCLIACLINPNGYQTLLYPFNYVGSTPHSKFLTEWWPTNFKEEPFFEILIILLIISPIIRKNALWSHYLPLLVFLHLSLISGRNIPFFSFLAVITLAKNLEGWKLKIKDKWKKFEEKMLEIDRFGTAIVQLLISYLIFFAISNSYLWQYIITSELQASLYPVKATQFLKINYSTSRIFNFYAWGGYLMWKGGLKVFIDGRADLYADGFLQEYMKISYPKDDGWQKLLQQHRIELVIFPPNSFLTLLLKNAPDWMLVYEDEIALIFKKVLDR